MKQILPEGICRKCKDPCCHFLKGEDEHAPFFTEGQHSEILKRGFKVMRRLKDRKVWQPKLRREKDDYVCAFLVDNKCAVYDIRPLECRLWPFFITFNPEKTKVMLSLDLETFCPGIGKNFLKTESGKQYAEYLIDFLSSPHIVAFFSENPGLIHLYDPQFTCIGEIRKLSEVLA